MIVFLFNRLLKKAHLRRWPHPWSFRGRFNYASFQGISSPEGQCSVPPFGRYPVAAALSLDLFEQPVENEFFRKLLSLHDPWQKSDGPSSKKNPTSLRKWGRIFRPNKRGLRQVFIFSKFSYYCAMEMSIKKVKAAFSSGGNAFEGFMGPRDQGFK
jgi:hypothetical protein